MNKSLLNDLDNILTVKFMAIQSNMKDNKPRHLISFTKLKYVILRTSYIYIYRERREKVSE